ncbi:MAG: hypothetical protein HYZ60_01490 [Methylocystis sp.]|nr:hypothetical protein [Methylocystis sp.]
MAKKDDGKVEAESAVASETLRSELTALSRVVGFWRADKLTDISNAVLSTIEAILCMSPFPTRY